MFSIILTWIGVVLGLGVLVAMALGAVVVDVDDALGDRRRKKSELPESPGSPVTPLG